MSVQEQPRGRFPTDDGSPWPGQWVWGLDHSNDVDMVLAVHVGGEGDIKYGLRWIGPVDLTQPGAPAHLSAWAESTLMMGGYVHLFPACGEDSGELGSWVLDHPED